MNQERTQIPMKIEIEVKEVQPGWNGQGNGEPKVLPAGWFWQKFEDDDFLAFCVHGLKLRWSCDYCREHFASKEAVVDPTVP